MIKEITNYIGDNTAFTRDTNLFAVWAGTDVIDTCIVVTENSPGLADGLLDGKRTVPLTIYARATTPFTARDNAYTVFDMLHRLMQASMTAIGSGLVYVCNFVCGTPYYMGLDESGRRYVYAFTVNVEVTNET